MKILICGGSSDRSRIALDRSIGCLRLRARRLLISSELLLWILGFGTMQHTLMLGRTIGITAYGWWKRPDGPLEVPLIFVVLRTGLRSGPFWRESRSSRSDILGWCRRRYWIYCGFTGFALPRKKGDPTIGCTKGGEVLKAVDPQGLMYFSLPKD